MPAEISMPQLSDTMSEGTLVKWLKKEGEKVRAGEEIAEVETDKATMPMEAFDSGTLAAVLVQEGDKIPVGQVMGVIALDGEDVQQVKQQYAQKAGKPSGRPAPAKPAAQPKPASAKAPAKPAEAPAKPAAAPSRPAPSPSASPGARPTQYQYDILVIGGGPAGYAAAIRAGQLKKRVLCIEKENLGGTCLNWGCIPTKALLEDGAFIRRLRHDAAARGVAFDNLQIDFSRIIARSRGVAEKLSKGIAHLFRKYDVKYEQATGQLLGAHRVRIVTKEGAREVTADHILIAVGAKAVQLPGLEYDGRKIITSREAMTLPTQPRRMAIIGAGAIGCEFADFYNAVGTEVTIIELMPHLLPNEDQDISILLERSFTRRGIKCLTKTKVETAEATKDGVRLKLSGENAQTLEADVVLVAVGVTGNLEPLLTPECGLETFRNRVKVTPDHRTNLENVWAIGDCISLAWPEGHELAAYRHPDLAHVAHHEAINVVERMFGVREHELDYRFIPSCTYTHPQVASLGMSERVLREQGRQIRVGKFPFSVSGRALAAGEPEGFVKLIFDAQYGELLGAHMIGENVTELIGELVMARKLEATESEIIEAMHPHPTMSEAVMEAAGVADARAIHL